jgi:hypothetical protein
MGVGPDNDKKYVTLFDRHLRLGFVQVLLGTEKVTWQDIYGRSTINKR